MEKEIVIERYGIDPDTIGIINLGWSIIDEMLIVMTKDKIHGSKSCEGNNKFTNRDNFAYTSGDILDDRLLYYYFYEIGKKPKREVKACSEHAQIIMDSMRRDDEHDK